MVRFAARSEYARTVEDVLARRWRLLFLDARLAGSLAGEVGAILAAGEPAPTRRSALSRNWRACTSRCRIRPEALAAGLTG